MSDERKGRKLEQCFSCLKKRFVSKHGICNSCIKKQKEKWRIEVSKEDCPHIGEYISPAEFRGCKELPGLPINNSEGEIDKYRCRKENCPIIIQQKPEIDEKYVEGMVTALSNLYGSGASYKRIITQVISDVQGRKR